MYLAMPCTVESVQFVQAWFNPSGVGGGCACVVEENYSLGSRLYGSKGKEFLHPSHSLSQVPRPFVGVRDMHGKIWARSS